MTETLHSLTGFEDRGVALCWLDLDSWPLAGDEALSDAERQRAARFRFERHRRRYVAGRLALRQVLAERLRCAPATLQLGVDRFDKPRLDAPQASIGFNVSHSEQVCLIGVSESGALGVDVELHRRVDDAQSLARAHFGAGEWGHWADCAPEERDRAFLRCWTRKEACLKALGVGLQVEPSSFEAGMLHAGATCTIAHEGRHTPVAVWSLEFATGTSAIAAVALAGAPALPSLPTRDFMR